MPDAKPQPAPHRNKVEVKTDGGQFLFLYHADLHVLEIHKRGLVYRIPLFDLIEFGRTSERRVFRVIPNPNHTIENGDEVIRQTFE